MYISSYADTRYLLSCGICSIYSPAAQRSRKAPVSVANVIQILVKKKRPPEGGRCGGKPRAGLFLDLARLDLARPLAGRRRALLDELLEALEVVLDPARGGLDQCVANCT